MKHFTIRVKLIIAFLAVALSVSAVFLIQSYYNNQKSEAQAFTSMLEQYRTGVLKMTLVQNDFIDIDLNSVGFYKTQVSKRLSDNEYYQSEMMALLDEMAVFRSRSNKEFQGRVSNLKHKQSAHAKAFENITEATIDLGFKDYGITGEMRSYAHSIEANYPELIPAGEILMLRRHEKDFIVRKEDGYIEKFVILSDKIMKDLKGASKTPKIEACIKEFEAYIALFHELVQLSNRIGLGSDVGLHQALEASRNDLLQGIDDFLKAEKEQTDIFLAGIKSWFFAFLILSIVVAVLIVSWLSKILSLPIVDLATHIRHFIQSEFRQTYKIDRFENRKDEIGSLYGNFKMMAEEITVHFKNYRDNAEKKHKEIMAQKAEIEDKTLLLEDQRNLLAQQNKSMTDSISYAQRLQRSLFPNKDQMHQILGDHLLMFQPKDIVSGDFYWVEETADSVYFGVIDCTGHGVPGAFMSVLGYNYLSMALHVMDLRETNHILDFINKSISVRLNQHSTEGEIKDGMDLGLCRYIKGGNVVQFSGANRPVVVVKKGEAVVHNSDRLHIGWNFENQRQPFTSKEITLDENDIIYLFTDGYNDQFGGANDKKFKFNQFRALLAESDPKNLGRTSQLILDTFLTWKGNADQVDDVCVLGVRAGNLMEKAMGVKHIEALKTGKNQIASSPNTENIRMISAT